jgi:ribosomal protein S27E
MNENLVWSETAQAFRCKVCGHLVFEESDYEVHNHQSE